MNPRTAEAVAELTAAERAVADLLPIEADPADARRALDEVPFWFHTFALNRAEGIYAPGSARDHRYRIPALPEDFGGLRVLDVGTFDGFYAFLAEARGASRVLAVDNEQYIEWVRARWGIELKGGEGFRAIHRLLDSDVEYRVLDAFELAEVEERFDIVFCWGILHRVEDPGRLLDLMRRRLRSGGKVLLETHGVFDGAGPRGLAEYAPGEVYPDDDYVYWGFTPEGLDSLARDSGYRRFSLTNAPWIDGHPRVVGELHL